MYKRVLSCNLSHHHPRILHVVHNTSHAYKVKQDSIFYFIGTLCTGACLAQTKSKDHRYLTFVDPTLLWDGLLLVQKDANDDESI
jgi:hypothetical protein